MKNNFASRFIVILIGTLPVLFIEGRADDRMPDSSSAANRSVLLDGTTILANKDGVYAVESFPKTLANDSNTNIVLKVDRGIVRIIGGFLNDRIPITINTPSAILTMDKADSLVSVSNNGATVAALVHGRSLTVESGGVQRVIVKPGYEVISGNTDSPPSQARKQNEKIMLASLTAAESGSGNKMTGLVNTDVTTAPDQVDIITDAIDSDQLVFAEAANPSILPPILVSPTSTASGSLDVGMAADNFDGGISEVGQANGDIQEAHQLKICCDVPPGADPDENRARGLSTNRIFTSNDLFTQNISINSDNPLTLVDSNGDSEVNYSFILDQRGHTLVVDLDYSSFIPKLASGSADSSDTALILDGIAQGDIVADDNLIVFGNKDTEPGDPQDILSGYGNRFSQRADYNLLTTGFYVDPILPGFILREEENFLVTEVHAITTDPNDVEDNERYIFATGDVVSANQSLTSISVDRFFVSPGLSFYSQKNSGATKVLNIRAFARDETAIISPDSLSDSGLLVINHAAGSNQPTRVLHADFSLAGVGASQVSTVSTTLGRVNYLSTRFADPGDSRALTSDGANDVLLNASTLGSTQWGNTLVQFNSDVFNTSAGGGLQALGSGAGYADYFVLENYDPDDPGSGGTEHAIGTDATSDQKYAILRLASIQSSTPEPGLARTQFSIDGGYIAGLLSTERGANSLSIDFLLSSQNPTTGLNLSNDLSSSALSVDMTLNDGRTLVLGGGDSNSAFIDDDRYAATNGSVTLVSSGLVEDGIDNAIASTIDVPEYMQWGFFFGDVDNSANTTSHAHLTSWVAGSVPSAADLPTTGSATYSGSAIGNVFDGTNSYVATGAYTNTWNFGTRQGTARIQGFDGVDYDGITALETNSTRFEGALTNDIETREVGLQGSFVQNGGDAAAGLMGQFYIQNTDSNVYRAAGTFAAEKQ